MEQNPIVTVEDQAQNVRSRASTIRRLLFVIRIVSILVERVSKDENSVHSWSLGTPC